MLVRARGGLLFLCLMVIGAIVPGSPATAAECSGNAIVCENQKDGTPRSEWDIDGVGDGTIQGFATQISVNAGSRVEFKIDTDASAYTIRIYRLGYYGGDGAREVARISPSAALPQEQPACASDPATEIYDCGTWAVSASWEVPTAAVSGVYIARLIRTDTGGDSHIPFIVRNDGNTSAVLFQTSDTTWQAYNTYGGSNFYWGKDNGRAYKLSYNRPFNTRGLVNGRDFLFSNEYPMIRFLESNGYDVSYVSGLDTHLDPALITKHKVFLSVGHDEYWSQDQRDHVQSARDAGTNLAFFSGNEVYWKTRWEASQDGSSTPNRTLICYKDTWANGPIDPVTATPTWRDPRFGDLGHGPENELTGTLYQANSVDLAITVNAQEGKLRLWRDTALAELPSGSSEELAAHTVGYESNEDRDNGFRPPGLIRLSTTVGPTPELLQDFGNVVTPGTTTHHLTQYRAPSGALVFSAGTIQWAWGLDENHDGQVEPADPRIRQATVNILADMGALASTIAPGLVRATTSTDRTAPTSTITAPADDSAIPAGSLVTVEGTAADVGGRVGGVEVSVDGGATWHPAEGRGDFSYTGVLNGRGAGAIQARAIDDSGNLQSTPTKISIESDCPCTLFGAVTPKTPSADDSSAVTLGTRFSAAEDGFITGIRFYKGPGNTGTHTGTLYDESGDELATATFENETASGWQTVTFTSAVPVSADEEYIAAYFAPNGGYAADPRYFAYGDHAAGPLTAPGGGNEANGVFANHAAFPQESSLQTNYYVDAIYATTDTTPLTVPGVTPLDGQTSVPSGTDLAITFSRDVDPDSVTVTVLDPDGDPVTGELTQDGARKTVFDPTQSLAPATEYTATVTAETDDGQPIPSPYEWSFTTAKAPAEPGACPCTLFDDATNPAQPPETERDRVQLGIAFSSTIAGEISGIRFYKAPGNSGPHEVALWTESGERLATATATNESTAGWQVAEFAAAVAIDKNTTYLASYTAPTGGYSAQPGGLSEPRAREPLRTEERAGRYRYGDGPPLSESATNYFVDPVFNTAADAKPVVHRVSPGDDASSVPVAAAVLVTFESLVQPGTTAITVLDEDGDEVPGTVASEASNTSATFTPSSELAPGADYTIKISGARSLSGVPMDGPFTSRFRTAGACPCSLLDTSTTPVITDIGEPAAVSLGLRFSATTDGFIEGLRFYRSAANTGPHPATLWTKDGEAMATLTFPEGPVGWQTAQFDEPVEVESGTEYVASYFAPHGHYAAAGGYFDDPVINTPLRSVGTGGVFSYGTEEEFPDQSWGNSHYYVDVVFDTDDTKPPAVTAVTPQASFQPAVALSYVTSYRASVSASSAAGVAMPEPYRWVFDTAAAPPTGTAISVFPTTATPEIPAWADTDPVELGAPVAVDADTTYVASYLASTGHYAVSPGQFAEGYEAGPLSVPAGGSGFRYPAGFPSAGSTANYWVDVVLVLPQ